MSLVSRGRLFWPAVALLLSAAGAAAQSQKSAPESALFTEFPVVQAVTLHPETLDRAPAAVSVITAEQIRRYGYRTIGEALQAEAGFLVTSDHAYTYVGVRGFGIPGDYGSRLLIMVNGHAMSEPVYGTSALFGQEFGIDLEIIQRIEVIRGPSSALYGSSGVLATINIVTKAPAEMAKASGTATAGSAGDRSMQAATAIQFGEASLLVAVKGYRRSGETLDVPEYGLVEGRDGERSAHAFVDFRWKRWNITSMFSSRRKDMPVNWSDLPLTGYYDRAWDAPGYVDAVYTRDIGRSSVTWRTYASWYTYESRTYDESNGAVTSVDLSRTTRIGSRVTDRIDYGRFGAITVGLEANFDPRIVQQNQDFRLEEPLTLDSREKDVSTGLFAQWERDLNARVQVVAGVRHDWSESARGFVSPRAALIFHQSPETTYKLMWGRAFRNPNAYELYYWSPTYQLPSVNLRPESADTLELAADHQFNRAFSAGASAYRYGISGLIDFARADDDLWQFQNVGRDQAIGVEWRARARWSAQTELAASGSFEHATDRGGWPLTNSPRAMWRARGSLPAIPRRLTAAASARYVSERQTSERAALAGHTIVDVTLTTRRLHPNFELQAGVSNLFNRRYLEPTALALDAAPGSGRQVFVRLFWRTRD